MTFQPEDAVINDDDSEIVMKPKVYRNHYTFFPGVHTCTQSLECLRGLCSLVIAESF